MCYRCLKASTSILVGPYHKREECPYNGLSNTIDPRELVRELELADMRKQLREAQANEIKTMGYICHTSKHRFIPR